MFYTALNLNLWKKLNLEVIFNQKLGFISMTKCFKNDKKIDPRVRKTKRAIRSALKTLLTKKDLR